MKKSKGKKIKTPVPRPEEKRKKNERRGDKAEELFGVHIISDADIENHFGTPKGKSGEETPTNSAPPDEPTNKK